MRIEIKVYNTDIQNWILQGVEMMVILEKIWNFD